MMKAVRVETLNGPDDLVYGDMPDPAPRKGEVLIKLQTAALNRRDVFITYGSYPGIELPAIPGSDGAGVIAGLGEGVSGFAEGDDVIINPGLNWGDDLHKKGRNFHILGVPSNGTFAEYMTVQADHVYPKPQHLTTEKAAALPLAGLTAYRAVVTKGQVQAGDKVLVPGAGGGVATYLIQFASALGAHVYVTSSDPGKLAKAKELGAVMGVDYTKDEWHKDIKQHSGGIDLVLDSIGGEVFKRYLSVLNIGGRIVSFGATKGPVPELVMPKLFLKEITLYGSTMGSNPEFRDMLQLVSDKHIEPVIDAVHPITDISHAQHDLEAGRNFGKILLKITDVV